MIVSEEGYANLSDLKVNWMNIQAILVHVCLSDVNDDDDVVVVVVDDDDDDDDDHDDTYSSIPLSRDLSRS